MNISGIYILFPLNFPIQIIRYISLLLFFYFFFFFFAFATIFSSFSFYSMKNYLSS